MALGITNSIAANGETAITANLQMSGYKHTSVSDAVLRNQYASAGQVQDSTLQWGSTATGTADALAITLAPVVTAYVTGQRFPFISGAAANTTTTPTLAVNGLAAKTFVHKDGTALVAGDIAASTLYEAIYDGTNMRINTAGARGAGNAASAGANSDITSLSGLTTALSIAQGGTGATAANAAADALGAFRKGTILGTVSQTSGVPTGAVIETGTNANGTYTRWADGAQICTRSFTYSGSGWKTTFPSVALAALFIDGGYSVNITCHSDGTGYASIACLNFNAQAVGSFAIYPPSGVIDTGTTIFMYVTAIGRWF